MHGSTHPAVHKGKMGNGAYDQLICTILTTNEYIHREDTDHLTVEERQGSFFSFYSFDPVHLRSEFGKTQKFMVGAQG